MHRVKHELGDFPEILTFSLYLPDRKAVEGFIFLRLFLFSREGGSVIGRQAEDKAYGHLIIYQCYVRTAKAAIPDQIGMARLLSLAIA